ncbi:hypothetical protein FRC12_002433 [Ceratobasidium sp. 428]|nr:hypothetical protein FRC12_002433 [Ceratobasidium sp. 428]
MEGVPVAGNGYPEPKHQVDAASSSVTRSPIPPPEFHQDRIGVTPKHGARVVEVKAKIVDERRKRKLAMVAMSSRTQSSTGGLVHQGGECRRGRGR